MSPNTTNTMTETNSVVHAGLDIAKAQLQLHLQNQQHVLPNTVTGHQRLIRLLRVVAGVHVVCEATGNDAQQSDQALVAGDGVGQDMLLILEVELELGLGNVQAGMDDGVCFSHGVCGVRAHSCTYERAVVAAARSTVRVTDTRRERLRLPNERVLTVPEDNERAPIFLFGFQPNKEDEK